MKPPPIDWDTLYELGKAILIQWPTFLARFLQRIYGV